MKTVKFLVLALSFAAVAGTGCSAKQAYYGLQESSGNECRKLLNFDDYQQCMERADRSYEEYRRELNERREKDE